MLEVDTLVLSLIPHVDTLVLPSLILNMNISFPSLSSLT